MLRHGGYSPSQWVLGKTPRGPPSFMEEGNGSDLGSFEDQVDPESRFALLHKVREEAKKAFMHLDTSKRVQRALPRHRLQCATVSLHSPDGFGSFQRSV